MKGIMHKPVVNKNLFVFFRHTQGLFAIVHAACVQNAQFGRLTLSLTAVSVSPVTQQ
jgi:hypothetical protein